MKNTLGDAPAFDPARSDYPLGGEKTGPIWRAAWAAIKGARGDYLPSPTIVDMVQTVVPDAHPDTIRQILYRAVRAGILEQTARPVEGLRRPRLHFRIKVQ